MSYLVLARKWRPQTFADVVGQDHVVRTLGKAIEKDRLAHAYLFAGPRGCGKTTTARLLAKVINCEQPRGAEPCNECASCTAVAEGRHLDVIEIDGASNRGIDEIRDLREKIGYAPSQGRNKIYIIDEVHMLTQQAFNALLKTLEEPPPHVYLVFATTEPHKVPATILSRCQRFNFKRLELDEIRGRLELICRTEQIEYEEDALLMIARRAEGSLRDAQSLMDQCISAAEGSIDLDLVKGILGLVDAALVFHLLRAVAARNRAAALDTVDRVVSSGLDLEEFFLAWIEGLRNLMVLAAAGGERVAWLDLTDSEASELSSIGEAFRMEDLLFLFRAASRAFREFKGASQPRYLVEAAVAEAASWESAVEIATLLDHIETGGAAGGGETRRTGRQTARAGRRNGTAKRPAGENASSTKTSGDGGEANTARSPAASKATSRPGPRREGAEREAKPGGEHPAARTSGEAAARSDWQRAGGASVSGSIDALGGAAEWERFLAQVREAKLTLGIWLGSADVLGVEENRLLLGFGPQHRFAQEMIREEKNRRIIESHIERYFKRTLVVEVGGSTGSAAAEAPGEAPPAAGLEGRTETSIDLEGESPMLGRLIEEFDGRIVADDGGDRRERE